MALFSSARPCQWCITGQAVDLRENIASHTKTVPDPELQVGHKMCSFDLGVSCPLDVKYILILIIGYKNNNKKM